MARVARRLPPCSHAPPIPHPELDHLTPPRSIAIPVLAAILLAGSWPAAAAAASSTVECGQVAAYTAPDPITPADGSLTIGVLSPWTIVADATLSPAVTASMGSLNGPICFAVDRDDNGVITALDFVAQGDVSGAVVFDSGLGGYIIADRLLVPTSLVDTYPGLGGLFPTSAAAGTNVIVTFLIDVANGQFDGFSGHAAFCGAGDLAGNGDGLVGSAVIPVALLDAADHAALGGANLAHVCATVDTDGTIDFQNDGQLTINSDVQISAVPEPPATSTAELARGRPDTGSPIALLVALFVALFALRLTRRQAASERAA